MNREKLCRGDAVAIRSLGRCCTGWVELASDDQHSLYLRLKQDGMIAGCIGGIPLAQHEDGTYRCLFNDIPVEVAKIKQ